MSGRVCVLMVWTCEWALLYFLLTCCFSFLFQIFCGQQNWPSLHPKPDSILPPGVGWLWYGHQTGHHHRQTSSTGMILFSSVHSFCSFSVRTFSEHFFNLHLVFHRVVSFLVRLKVRFDVKIISVSTVVHIPLRSISKHFCFILYVWIFSVTSSRPLV